MKYLLLLGLLLQSCAITTTETKIVPGKELSKTSLGLREIENKNIMKEITPYSVGVFRKVCDAELFRVEYKGVSESVHKRQELYCASAYIEYIGIQITTLGLHFFYDMATGFGVFSGMCNKGLEIIGNDTHETNATVSQEVVESNNTICRDIPVSNAEVLAEIDGNISRLTSSTSGIAALGSEFMDSVKNLKRDVVVSYRYMGETIKTTIRQTTEPIIQTVKSGNQNATKMGIETGSRDVDSSVAKIGKTNIREADVAQSVSHEPQMVVGVDGQTGSVKNELSHEPLEDKAYKITLAALGKYKDGLPNRFAESDKKTVQVSFRVAFDFNEADVNEENLGGLKKFIETMNNNPGIVCFIEGHTDDLGSTQLSYKMSLQRASALKDIFVSKYGIAAKRIQVNGYGSTKPLADSNPAEGSARNRRIEIYTAEAAAGL